MGEDRTTLPDGLDWDTALAAVQIIEDWELRADGLAIDLVVRLYELLSAREVQLMKRDKRAEGLQ